MTSRIFVFIAVAAVVLLLLGMTLGRRRRRKAVASPERSIPVARVAREVRAFIEARPGNGSYLILRTQRFGADDGAGFAQVSIEHGVPGVDHVLNVAINRQAEAHFVAAMTARNHEIVQRELNGVAYLRVVTNDPGPLIERVLIEVHGLGQNEEVRVFGEVVEGRQL